MSNPIYSEAFRERYMPADGDGPQALATKAYRCGYDLPMCHPATLWMHQLSYTGAAQQVRQWCVRGFRNAFCYNRPDGLQTDYTVTDTIVGEVRWLGEMR